MAGLKKIKLKKLTLIDTLRSLELMRVDDPFLTSYHAAANQPVLRITLHRDSSSVCDRIGCVSG